MPVFNSRNALLLPVLADSIPIYVRLAPEDSLAFCCEGNPSTIAWLAMLIWAFVKVPSHGSLFHQSASISGSKLSWAWLSALNSALGIYSTLL